MLKNENGKTKITRSSGARAVTKYLFFALRKDILHPESQNFWLCTFHVECLIGRVCLGISFALPLGAVVSEWVNEREKTKVTSLSLSLSLSLSPPLDRWRPAAILVKPNQIHLTDRRLESAITHLSVTCTETSISHSSLRFHTHCNLFPVHFQVNSTCTRSHCYKSRLDSQNSTRVTEHPEEPRCKRQEASLPSHISHTDAQCLSTPHSCSWWSFLSLSPCLPSPSLYFSFHHLPCINYPASKMQPPVFTFASLRSARVSISEHK